VKEIDSRGSTPLHLAVARSQPSLDLVKFLVGLPFPTARARDGRGLLPLQVAAEADAPLELLYWLAGAWPEAVYSGSPRPASTRDRDDRPTRPRRPKRHKRSKHG
jgi:hypothetical protein